MRERLLGAAEFVVALAVVAGVLVATLSAWEPVRVGGRSMSPALLPGDLAIVARGAIPRQGDIVLIRAPGHGPVLHRIVGLRAGQSMTTRGDANPVDDRETVSTAEVSGVVVRVVPAGKLLRRWRGAE
jgi:signal peptidase I